MNILVLNYEFPPVGGGGGTMSRELAKKLKERGHDITVITMGFAELPAQEMVDGIRVCRVKCLRKSASVCYPWEQLTYICSALHYVKKQVDVKRFHVCHAHFIIPTGVIAWYLNRRCGIPYVLTAHGSDVEGYNQKRFKLMHKLVKPMWKRIVRASRLVISPSEYLFDLLQKSDLQGNYKIIPNGIDLKYYHTLSKQYIKKKQMVVMCRLQEPKGVQTVIRAFGRLSAADWMLHILGDGPFRPELESLVAELGLGGRVVFHGWVENKSGEYEQVLGSSAVYLSASRFENCPMSVLEAAASGCKLLLSDIPAHRQMIARPHVFFPVDDVDELGRKLQELLAEPEMVQGNESGEAAAPEGEAIRTETAAGDYGLDAYDWPAVLDAYEEVLRG